MSKNQDMVKENKDQRLQIKAPVLSNEVVSKKENTNLVINKS
jgi:hypothetical protein